MLSGQFIRNTQLKLMQSNTRVVNEMNQPVNNATNYSLHNNHKDE